MIRRVILSRKGCDSAAGGCPSPILPDGRLVPLPIPQAPPSTHRYRDLTLDGVRLADYLSCGGRARLHGNQSCHFDPQLDGSLGLLGQHGAAQGELARHGVGVGDLFLFFGWFRSTSDRSGSGVHHLFGWLQVTQVIRGTDAIKAFLGAKNHRHPHSLGAVHGYRQNTLYVSEGGLMGSENPSRPPAFGRFRFQAPAFTLTEPGATRSRWRLPQEVFDPSMEPFLNRLHWLEGDSTRVQPRGFGQEFILDAARYPALAHWARRLIASA